MGATIDILAGRIARYITCDACGHPILGTPRVDPPSGARDYERYTHPDACPDDDVVEGESA